MNGISASLLNAGIALQAYGRVLEATQNNVINASTPGYARQSQELRPLPFEPESGSPGGVALGELTSARDQYSEQAVRTETSSLGFAQQSVESLSNLESILDISGDSGLPYALNNLFSAFSGWAQSPGDTIARSNVIDRAQETAVAFRNAASALSNASRQSETQLRSTVDSINQLVAKVAEYNQPPADGVANDAGREAQFYSTLEELSQYADVTVARQSDGTLALLLEGQTPLLIGDTQYEIAFDLNQTDATRPASARITGGGRDVTAAIEGGKLGALLKFRNETLPSFSGDAGQAGSLNILAKQFADRVNAIMTGGYSSVDAAAPDGVALFDYGAAGETSIASALRLNEAATAESIAPVAIGPPVASNGIPLQLASLASPTSDADRIDGASYVEYFGRMAASEGSALSSAKDSQAVQESSVAQAKAIRQQSSGVSLDEEAVVMLEYQRGYQAVSRLITILDQLTEDTINMLRV